MSAAGRVRTETGLWLAQRLSAVVLAVAVAVHLATMTFAMRSGLSAAEILSRTEGNTAWLAFYVVFAAAAAVHAPIGLRTVLIENAGVSGRAAGLAAIVLGLLLIGLGWRAAFGLYAPGAG